MTPMDKEQVQASPIADPPPPSDLIIIRGRADEYLARNYLFSRLKKFTGTEQAPPFYTPA
jgi:hypothetical protein